MAMGTDTRDTTGIGDRHLPRACIEGNTPSHAPTQLRSNGKWLYNPLYYPRYIGKWSQSIPQAINPRGQHYSVPEIHGTQLHNHPTHTSHTVRKDWIIFPSHEGTREIDS